MLLITARKILSKAGLDRTQKIVIVSDNKMIAIGQAFFKAAWELVNQNKLGSFVMYNLDDIAQRPLKQLPEKIKDAVMDADLLIQVISKVYDRQHNEFVTYRKPVIDLKYKNPKLRIGQMLDVTPEQFIEAFRYDPVAVKVLNSKIYKLLTDNDSNEVRIKTPMGTDAVFEVSNRLKWINQDGNISRVSPQHSLLAGEVYGCPEKADGVIVADGVIGGPFMKYGELLDTPIIIQLKKGRIKSVACKNSELESDFVDYLSSYENGNRVGELGFGTNTSLKRFYGVLAIDEKFPGNHIAFGHPYSERTGADWSCAVHIDCVLKNCSTWIGDKQVLFDGRYVL